MEEKERYELTDTDCIFDTERDIVVSDVCDVITNADIITDLLNQQDKRIKELEEENQQLKQQLAEKDKEIEQLKKFDDLNKTFFDLFRTTFKEPDKVDDLFNTLKTIQEKQEQDKISFAVEKLEQVKETAECVLDNALKNSSLNQSYYDRLLDEIDNQIKQLKDDEEE